MKEKTCTATARSGERCRKAPARGARVCRMHGGAAPQVKARSAVRAAEAQAQQVLRREQVVPVVDPLTALSELAGEVVALKDYFRQRLDGLAAEAWRYQAGAGEQLRAEVALYERALDRTARLLGDMARLNLDERLARLTEAQGLQIVAVVRASLLEVGVDPGSEVVQQVVMRHFKSIGGGA